MTGIDDRVAQRLRTLATAWGAQPGDPPTTDEARDDATPYAWQAGDGTFHITVSERGQVLSDIATPDADEFAYRYAEILSTAIAQRLHPIVEPAARQAAWAQQYRLLASVDPGWALRWRDDLRHTLAAAGSTDGLALLP